MFREVAILCYCNHPNIMRIIGVYFNENNFSVSIIMPRYYLTLHEILFRKNAIYTIPNKKSICC